MILGPKTHLTEGADVLVEPVTEAGWMKCVGTISDDDARGMLAAIEETREKIESGL